MKATTKPNFLVVGAPKSGTTSLYFYLKEHPQIFLPRIKELNFFCTDLHFKYPLLTENQFLNYYDGWRNEKAIGEVSVWNLYSQTAAQQIHRFIPSAKILILLRHPVDMMYALHSNHVFNNNEIIDDFEEALNAQEDRRKGLRISSTIKCPVEGLYYFEVASYYHQVKRYLELFGKAQVKIILFDDLAGNTNGVYDDILKFLEVSDYKPAGFKVFNSSKTTRSSWIKQLTINAPSWLKGAGQWLFPHQSKRRDLLMFWLWKLNTREVKRKELDPGLRKQLTEKFRNEIINLQSLIGRDLTHWLR